MKCLDGIQGPICMGTGCVFRRQALYGFNAPGKKNKENNPAGQVHAVEACTNPNPEKKLEKRFGQSPVLVSSAKREGIGSASSLDEALHVIRCAYEDRTEWGKEVHFWAMALRFDLAGSQNR